MTISFNPAISSKSLHNAYLNKNKQNYSNYSTPLTKEDKIELKTRKILSMFRWGVFATLVLYFLSKKALNTEFDNIASKKFDIVKKIPKPKLDPRTLRG